MNKKTVITFSGRSGHGKDHTANIVKDILTSLGYRVMVIHFADTLKYCCKQYYGWDGVKDEYGRTLLQKVGTDLREKNHLYGWAEITTSIMKIFSSEYDMFIIPDLRLVEENEYLDTFAKKENWNFFRVRVMRYLYNTPTAYCEFPTLLTKEQYLHRSETDHLDFVYDFSLENRTVREDNTDMMKKCVMDQNARDIADLISALLFEIGDKDDD